MFVIAVCSSIHAGPRSNLIKSRHTVMPNELAIFATDLVKCKHDLQYKNSASTRATKIAAQARPSPRHLFSDLASFSHSPSSSHGPGSTRPRAHLQQFSTTTCTSPSAAPGAKHGAPNGQLLPLASQASLRLGRCRRFHHEPYDNRANSNKYKTMASNSVSQRLVEPFGSIKNTKMSPLLRTVLSPDLVLLLLSRPLPQMSPRLSLWAFQRARSITPRLTGTAARTSFWQHRNEVEQASEREEIDLPGSTLSVVLSSSRRPTSPGSALLVVCHYSRGMSY
jgi:hypothetical protein